MCYVRFIQRSSEFTLTNELTPGANKSLARPGRKEAAHVKNVMGRGMDCFG